MYLGEYMLITVAKGSRKPKQTVVVGGLHNMDLTIPMRVRNLIGNSYICKKLM